MATLKLLIGDCLLIEWRNREEHCHVFGSDHGLRHDRRSAGAGTCCLS